MKKLLTVMVGLLAFLMVFMSFNDINMNQGTNLHLVAENTAKALGENTYYVSLKNVDNTLINDLVSFGSNHKITYVINNSYKDDNCLYTIFDHYLFSNNEAILCNYDIETNNAIDFSKVSNKYYSTAEDNNSNGIIRILDNNFFDRYLEIHHFKSLGTFQSDSSIYFQVVCSQDTFKEFLDWISDRYEFTDLTNQMSSVVLYEDYEVVSKQVKQLLKIGILLCISIMAVIIIRKQRTYMIQRMMGTSTFRIVFREFGKLFVFLILDFTVICFFSFIFLCRENSASRTSFMSDIFGFVGLFIVVLAVIWLLISIFIQMVSSVKYLNTNHHFDKLFYTQTIIRVIVIVILIGPIMNSIDSAKPYISNYMTVKDMKEMIVDMYSFDYIPERSENIFYDFYDEAYYCNFSSYYSNYRLIEEDDTIKEDIYPYPFIRVNEKYMDDYHPIYDLNGNKLDLDDFVNNTIFIPEEFKDGDLSMYQIDNEDIVYIKNTGDFYNYKLEEPFKLTNPIIYLEREYSFETKIQSYFFKTNNIKNLQNQLDLYSTKRGEMKLISTQYRYDYFSNSLFQEVIEFGLLVLIYAVMLVVLVVQSLLVYFNEHGKLVAISYSLGRGKIRRYFDLIMVNILSYVGILIAGYMMNLKKSYLFIFMVLLFMGELIITMCYSKYLEKQKLVVLLKGGN